MLLLVLDYRTLVPHSSLEYADSLKSANHTWLVKKFKISDGAGANYELVKVLFDGKMVHSYNSGGSNDIGFLHVPGGSKFIVTIGHSWAGNGKYTKFYRLGANGKVKLILDLDIQNGGPVFRDMDGDGRVEWIFDSRDYYDDSQQEYGRNLLVYKPSKSGELLLWKQIPNRNKIKLPWLMGPGFDGKPFGFRHER